MSKGFGDYLKNYQQGKHLQSNKPSKNTGPSDSPVFSPLWTQIQSYLQSKSGDTTNTEIGSQRNLGILFIILDDFPNEVLWRAWMSDSQLQLQRESVKVWFHAKNPEKIQSDWVREHLVKSFHLRPSWGSLDLTKVMLGLLDEAMQGAPEVQRFIFASESCLPMMPLQRALDQLYEHDTSSYSHSWIHAKNSPNNGFARQKQFDIIEKRIPARYVWKSDQWIMISRMHGLQIVQLCDYLEGRYQQSIVAHSSSLQRRHITQNPIFDLFLGMNASDELFFATVLSLVGYQFYPSKSPEMGNASMNQVIIKRRVTFADWSDNGNSPKTFSPFHWEDFESAKEEDNICFRKIKCQSFLDDHVPLREKIVLFQKWMLIVYGKDAESNEALSNFASGIFSEPYSQQDRIEDSQRKKLKSS